MTPTYLLIAIYLSVSSASPTFQTQVHKSKESCKEAQNKYMTSQVRGSKWTICAKLNLKT